MWKERLSRLFLIAIATVLVLGLVKFSAQKNLFSSLKIGSVALPKLSAESQPPVEILESAKAAILGQKNQSIAQPAEKIEKQTTDLIESIKNLPEDQLEAIKKQIFQEFCQNLLKEEEKNNDQ